MPALTIAVPRGALLGETLDLLDGLGIDTAEVRANDRKLLFEDAGLVTMRPSDVPTYVEAGAADLGITGKDVLAEHPERDVYELLDLGRVEPEPVEQVERVREQRTARDGDRQAHRPSPTRAACRRSTSSAQPHAGSERPKRPSRSS